MGFVMEIPLKMCMPCFPQKKDNHVAESRAFSCFFIGFSQPVIPDNNQSVNYKKGDQP
jgi:hypothetical protein